MRMPVTEEDRLRLLVENLKHDIEQMKCCGNCTFSYENVQLFCLLNHTKYDQDKPVVSACGECGGWAAI